MQRINRNDFITMIPMQWRKLIGEDFLASTVINDIINEIGIDFSPLLPKIFIALQLVQPKDVSVAFIGKTPSPSTKIATGLSYCENHVKYANIIKEIMRSNATSNATTKTTSNATINATSNATSNDNNQILLLNSMLTVTKLQRCKAYSLAKANHTKWLQFTAKLLQQLDKFNNNIVYVTFNKDVEEFLKRNIRYGVILTFPNPSPLNGNKFYGCNCFNIINNVLTVRFKRKPINWINSLLCKPTN